MRQIRPSVAELIDRLTIDQVKQVFDREGTASVSDEMASIESDLDYLLPNGLGVDDSTFLRLIVALAQINLQIWFAKDAMQTKPVSRPGSMKSAHQLNGVRNRIKNRILALEQGGLEDTGKSNVETDGLDIWEISVLREPGRT